jgi:hypothetical protein
LVDPSNIVFTNKDKKMIIVPTYMTIVIKGLDNIAVQDGKVDINYTLVIRFAKEGLDEKAISSLSTGFNIRINNNLVTV